MCYIVLHRLVEPTGAFKFQVWTFAPGPRRASSGKSNPPLAPCAPLLLERQRRAFRRHHLGDIERHRDGGVIAAHADQIDHTPLAEQRKGAVERRIVDVPGAVKLDAKP